MARSQNHIPNQNRKYHSFLQKTWRSNVKSRTKSVTKFEQILSLKNTLKCLPTYYGDLPNRPESGCLKKTHRVSVVRATHHYFLHIYNLEFAFVKKTSQKRPFWSGLIQLSNLIEHLEAHQFAKNISMTSNKKNKRSVKNFYFDRIVEKWIKCLFLFVPFWGNGILLPKLFWPTVRKKCSSDWEKFLKFKARVWGLGLVEWA